MDLLALDFAELWVKEYASAASGERQRIECLAGLLLEPDVSESSLQDTCRE